MVSFAYHNRSDAMARQALTGRNHKSSTVSIKYDAIAHSKIQSKPVIAAQWRNWTTAVSKTSRGPSNE
jgi:hypothetical protein